jgi:cytochrome c oxidase subunit IV
MSDVGTPVASDETVRESEDRALAEEPELVHHPDPRQYIVVAVVLAIATAFEVAIYYTSIPHPLLVAFLIFAAIFKFSLVVLWFMHLRFDSKIFRRMFLAGLGLALSVYTIVLFTFRVFIRK